MDLVQAAAVGVDHPDRAEHIESDVAGEDDLVPRGDQSAPMLMIMLVGRIWRNWPSLVLTTNIPALFMLASNRRNTMRLPSGE